MERERVLARVWNRGQAGLVGGGKASGVSKLVYGRLRIPVRLVVSRIRCM